MEWCKKTSIVTVGSNGMVMLLLLFQLVVACEMDKFDWLVQVCKEFLRQVTK